MGAEIIPIANVQANGAWFHDNAYTLFEEEHAIGHATNKPYFVFDVNVAQDRRAAVTRRIQTDLTAEDAAALLSFLESMDWQASFLYLG